MISLHQRHLRPRCREDFATEPKLSLPSAGAAAVTPDSAQTRPLRPRRPRRWRPDRGGRTSTSRAGRFAAAAPTVAPGTTTVTTGDPIRRSPRSVRSGQFPPFIHIEQDLLLGQPFPSSSCSSSSSSSNRKPADGSFETTPPSAPGRGSSSRRPVRRRAVQVPRQSGHGGGGGVRARGVEFRALQLLRQHTHACLAGRAADCWAQVAGSVSVVGGGVGGAGGIAGQR